MSRQRLYARFFALIKALGITEGEKYQIITAYSNPLNDSLKAMTDYQLNNAIKSLQLQQDKAVKKIRGRIIHLLCELGMTTEDDKPDYERIKQYIQNIGKNNPRRATLNYLNQNELKAILKQIEAWANTQVKKQV